MLTALGSSSGDGSHEVGLNTAIESFWRWKLVKIWRFLWAMGVPGGPRGLPVGSQGRAGGPRGVPRGPRGVTGGPRGVPRGSGGVPGILGIRFIKMTPYRIP